MKLFSRSSFLSLTLSVVAYLALSLMGTVLADTASFTPANSSVTVTGATPVTMNFPSPGPVTSHMTPT